MITAESFEILRRLKQMLIVISVSSFTVYSLLYLTHTTLINKAVKLLLPAHYFIHEQAKHFQNTLLSPDYSMHEQDKH